MIWMAQAEYNDGRITKEQEFPAGWMPYEERDADQQLATDEFHERIGSFSVVGTVSNDTPPERVIYAEYDLKYNGKLSPIVHQQTGSCVGAGGANCYMMTMLGDIFARGDNEEVKSIFPFATYGVGRDLAGMRRKGDGSYGGAQAKACNPEYFGYLAWDDPRVPKPSSTRNGWWAWTRSQEYAWSHPSAWPVNRRELQPTASNHGIVTLTRLRNSEDVMNAVWQFRGITIASMFGATPRRRGDVLFSEWTRQWAHQMSVVGYWKHPQLGLIFLIQNQWNDVHGHCPTAHGDFGLTGCFWTSERVMDRIGRSGEIYAHSGTGDFAPREFRWTSQATYV